MKWGAVFMVVLCVGSRVCIPALPPAPCVTLALESEKWVGNG